MPRRRALRWWRRTSRPFVRSSHALTLDMMAQRYSQRPSQMVGLDPSAAHKMPADLSGGMVKRVPQSWEWLNSIPDQTLLVLVIAAAIDDIAVLGQLGDNPGIEEALEHCRGAQALGALLQIG